MGARAPCVVLYHNDLACFVCSMYSPVLIGIGVLMVFSVASDLAMVGRIPAIGGGLGEPNDRPNEYQGTLQAVE